MPLLEPDRNWLKEPLKTHLGNEHGLPACGEVHTSPTTEDPDKVTCEKCLARIGKAEKRR